MRSFEVTVTREDKYIIEFDENKFNQEWMDEFKKVFYDFDSLQEHAEHIAQHRARFHQAYIEGYGAPMVDGREPFFLSDKSSIQEGINIRVIDEDDEIETTVYEL